MYEIYDNWIHEMYIIDLILYINIMLRFRRLLEVYHNNVKTQRHWNVFEKAIVLRNKVIRPVKKYEIDNVLKSSLVLPH
jgi:hypothetical protein